MADLGDIVAHLKLEMGEFTNSLNVAQTQVSQTADKFRGITSAGKALQGVGAAMTAGITAPVMALGAASIKTAMETDSSFAKMNSILQLSGNEWKNYESEIMAGADKLQVKYAEYGEAAYEAISSGVKQADVTNFLTDANTLAVGGFTSLTGAVDILTTVQNAYGLSQKDMIHVSDVLIKTQNLGKVEVNELAASMGKVIPTANSLGVSIDQLGAGYAIMTSKGIDAAESTTYMNAMFNELGKSGTVVDKTLKEISGKSFKELTAEGKSVGDILGMLDEHAKKSGKSLSDLFGSSEAGKAALTLLSDGVDGYNKSLDQMVNSQGAAKEGMTEIEKTSSKQFEKAMASCSNALESFGRAFLPVLTGIVKAVGGFAQMAASIGKAHPWVVKLVGAFALLLAAIGPFLLIIGTLGAKAAALREGFVMLKTVFGLCKTGILLLKTVIMDSLLPALTSLWGVLIANPVFLVIAVIAALVGAFIYLWNNCEGFKEFWINLWENIKTWCSNAIEAIKAQFSTWGDQLTTFFTETVPNAFNTFLTFMSELPEKVFVFLLSVIFYVILWVGQMYLNAIEGGAKFIQGVIQFIQQLPGKVWTFLKNCVYKTTQWVQQMYQKAKDGGTKFLNGVIQFLQQLPGKVWKWLTSTISKAIQFVSQFAAKGKQAASEFVTKITTGLANLPSKMYSVGKSIVQGIINGVKDAASGLYTAIKNMCAEAWNNACEALDINSPSKLFRKTVGYSIPEGMALGVIDKANLAYKAVKKVATGMWDTANSVQLKSTIDMKSADIGNSNPQAVSTTDRELASLRQLLNKKEEIIDYDRLGSAVGKAVADIDSVVVMDKTIVGKKVAPTVKEQNNKNDKRNNRLKGEVDYV